jgi:hypothetical protein
VLSDYSERTSTLPLSYTWRLLRNGFDYHIRGRAVPMTAMAQASDPSQVIGPLSLFELGAVNSRPCEKMCKLLGRAVNDPYHEFIPAMLERYNIDADWLQNTLSVVCGDEVQDVRFNEQPLLAEEHSCRQERVKMLTRTPL